MDKHLVLITFGKAIRKERVSICLSQEELASKAEIDRSYLGAIERGEHNLSLVNVIKISKALNIPPSKLFENFLK